VIKSLAHVCLISRNLDRTQDFYCEVLGMRKKFDFYKGEELIGFYLEVAPNQFLEVFRGGEGAEAEAQAKNGIRHFCLEVGDIEAVRQKLISSKIGVTEKTLGSDASWQIWCKDPDGIDVEFHQYTPESSQCTGTRCNVSWQV
jgi:catechol 2,3-dioxygenase-like lactoylglutathione lyase family enzyme